MKTNHFVTWPDNNQLPVEKNILRPCYRLLLAIFYVLLSLQVLAENVSFTVNRINYTIIEGTLTCRTTAGEISFALPDGKKAGNSVSGSVTIPNQVSHGGTSYTVVEIGDYSFWKNEITSISLPENLTRIGIQGLGDMTTLKTVTFSSSSIIEEIGQQAFEYNYSLEEIRIPASVRTLGNGALKNCESLKRVTFASTDKLEKIDMYAFSNCTSLKSITLPTSITSIGNLAFVSSGLESIVLPNSVTTLGIGVLEGCENLTSVTLPAHITSLPNRTFNGCTKLVGVNIPEVVKTIGSSSFYNCSSLKGVNFPDKLKTIGDNAFENCSAIETVTLPATVTNIGKSAYAGCTSLIIVYNYATTPQYTSSSFPTDIASNVDLAVYKPYINAYKNSTYDWKNFRTISAIAVKAQSISLEESSISMTVGSNQQLKAILTPVTASEDIVWTSSNQLVATVDGDGKVSAIKAGTTTVTANCEGFTATCQITVSAPLPTGITLNKTEATIMDSGNIQLTATVSPDGVTTPITWESLNTDIAKVSNNGLVTGVKVGTATITATCGSVSAKSTITVSPTPVSSVTLKPTSQSINIGESVILTATVSPSEATNKTVTWTSSDVSVATVNSSGEVTGVKEGKTIITAKAGEKTATCEVTVKPIEAESITIMPASVTLNVGGKTTLKATVLPTNTTDQTVTWKSSKPEIVQVEASTGEVTAISPGQATITATCGAVTKTCVVTVNPVLAEKVTISAPAKQVMVRDDLQLTATVAPENTTDKTLIWSSSNNEIAKVDQNGLVTTALIAGKVTITAKSKGNESAYGTLQIEVIPRSREIDGVIYEMVYVNPGSISDNDYIKVIGYATGQPASGELTILPQILTSKDRTLPVKEVEKDAFNGNAAITSIVIPKSVSKVGAGAFANCSNLRDVRIDDSSETLECGDGMFAGSPFVSLYLGRHTSGTVLSGHKSLDDLQIGTSVTKIDANEFTGCAPITNLVVYATTPPAMPDNGFDQTVYDNTVLRVPDDVVNKYKTAQGWTKFNHNNILGINQIPAQSISLSSELSLTVGGSKRLEVAFNPTDVTSKALSWSSSNESVASVSSTGVVVALTPGEVTITATTTNGKTAECKVTVNPIRVTTVTVEPAVAEITVGDVLSLSASIDPDDATDQTIGWSTSDTAVATVDDDGNVKAIAPGAVTVTAKSPDGPSAECQITIVAAHIDVKDIVLDAEELRLKVGATGILKANIYPGNATDQSVVWSSSDAEIVSVDNAGNLTALSVGSAIITATTPNGLSAQCKVTVIPVLAESITIEPETAKLDVGEEMTLKATVLPTNTTDQTVTWKSSKPEIVQVEASTGEVTAISPGQATITATCGAVTKTCVVTVNPVLAEKVTISAPAKQVMVRDDLQLTATVAPENTTDKTLIWSSSNNEIAKVDQNGLVTTALIAGKVTITAKSKGNESAYGTLQIEVIPRSREIDGVIYEMVYVNPGSISDNDYIKVIGYATGQPASGELTILPQILTSKDRTLPVKEVEKDAFNGNAAITSIVIPKSVSKVGAGAFANCSNLRDVRIDDSSETLECGDGMFAGSPFVSLYLGRHTSGTVLSGHKSLDDLQIGTSVTKIDANEFTGCAPITNLVVYATTPPAMPDNGFDQTVYDNTVLRVPDDVVNKYKTAQGWTKFNHNNILGINQIPAQSISLSSELSLTVGGSKRLEVAFNPTDVTSKALSWSSSNESVASVSSTGVVVALTPGEVTITATTTNGKTAECKVTVNPIRVTTVTVEPAVAEITVGDVLSLSASIDPDDATDQTIGWSTSDTAVATVDDDGNVKAIAPGAVTVTAKSPDGPSAECQITIVAAHIDVKDIVLDAESLTLREGASGVLKAHIYPENATDQSVTWSSSEPEVATVDESGNVKALKQGMTIIAATTANGMSAECMVTVTPASKPATGIALNLSQVELLQWEEVQLIATVTPAESDDVVVWSTSDMEVANVDDYGRVTTLSPGTVTITATTISGVSASCVVKVAAAPMGLSLDRDNADLVVGGELQLNAEVYPAEAAAHKLVWRSSNPEIATVDMQGKVKGIAPGSATVTVRTVNGLEIGCTVSVKMAPTSIALNFTHYEIAEQDRMQLIAIVEPTDMTYSEVTWSSSNEQVVYVNEDGIINSYSPGSAIVTARTINGLEATCEVTVVGYDVRLNVLSATLYKGEQLSMIARVTPGKGYYAADGWSSSDEGVATVADDGTVIGVEVGTAYINYYVGSSGYDYCPVIVIERNPVEEGPEITFSEVAVRPGQTLELGNTVDPEVTWTSTDESVIKVDDNGNIVAVGEGEAIVIATDASGVTSTCSVVVATQAPIPVMDIFFNGDQTLKEGESLQLMPEIYPYEAYNKTLTYESNAPEIVVVDENGVITALRAGEAVITATTSNGLLATCVVIVEANTTGIEDVDSDSSISVRVENREIIVVAPEGADVEVYNLSGVLVRRTRDHRISDLTRGVYVVRVAGKAFKVSL